MDKIQKFLINVEVDFSNQINEVNEEFGEAVNYWYCLNHEYRLIDEVSYTIDDLIEYKQWVSNNMYASIPRDIIHLIKQMYQEDFNEEEPFFVELWQIKIISIEGYQEEE